MRHFWAASFLISAVIGSGAAVMLANGTFAQQKDAVTIMSGLDGAYTGFQASIKKGFFEKENINAQYKMAEDGNVALDAILTGGFGRRLDE